MQARWKQGSRYYPGKIIKKNPDGTMNILYDDGDIEFNIQDKFVRPIDGLFGGEKGEGWCLRRTTVNSPPNISPLFLCRKHTRHGKVHHPGRSRCWRARHMSGLRHEQCLPVSGGDAAASHCLRPLPLPLLHISLCTGHPPSPPHS